MDILEQASETVTASGVLVRMERTIFPTLAVPASDGKVAEA
jgi:hypothetical protein